MKFIAAALALLPLTAAAQVTVPAWAFPNTTPEIAPKPPYDSLIPLHLGTSTKTFTMAQMKDFFFVPDWYPTLHPPMPDIVKVGRKPQVFACAYCHLADGGGRSENAVLAGLPVDYIIRQVADIKSGARKEAIPDWSLAVRMHSLSQAVTEAEVAEAARYFNRLKARKRYTVIESATVPLTLEAGGLYVERAGGRTEPLGARIIEMTTDLYRHELRDPNETFTAYVPPGSIATGRKIASKTCATCHGPTLRGLGPIPPIAGRSPLYVLRQLLAISTGTRSTPASMPMQQLVEFMTLDEMIAVSAYAGSLKP
jgi:cytochrome c553